MTYFLCEFFVIKLVKPFNPTPPYKKIAVFLFIV